jgi:peptidoglycan/xylan/chitin deacetylase (PgdA/CDA1 family)
MRALFLWLIYLMSIDAKAIECSFTSQADLGKEVLSMINAESMTCLKKDVHITFDDGPSQSVTPEILKELNLRGIKATFFVTTTNLDQKKSQNWEKNRALVQQTLDTGHLIANHGYDHEAYDLRFNGKVFQNGFGKDEREKQIATSTDLLNWSTGGKFKNQTPLLFRFPYGRGAMPSEKELSFMAENGKSFFGKSYSERIREYRYTSDPLMSIAGKGYSHLGWNHDSGDSSFAIETPDRETLKKYIFKNIKGLCSSPKVTKVALFHDIKKMNISAIPVIADLGKCLGLNFITAQNMAKDSQVMDSAVLLEKNKLLVESFKYTQKRTEASLSGLSAGKCEKLPTIFKEEKQAFCFSEQYQKRYEQCSGGDSICYEGKWYSRMDPYVIENCNLDNEAYYKEQNSH